MNNSLGNKEIMANNIRRHLDELGLNVKEFATAMGFKYTTVLDWVNANTYPRIDKIELMANFFGVEKSDLVEERKINTINGDQNNVATMSGNINGNVSFGSSIQKEDLHEVASNLNLTDRELQEKTLTEVSDLRASQARLESAISLLMENQANVLASMKSVDETFKKMFMEMLKELKK